MAEKSIVRKESIRKESFMKDSMIRLICTTGISTALFVVLTMCLQVPVFENYYLCLGYVIMAVCLYSFGIFCGSFVGVAGVILYCLLTNGLRGMPGWAAGNLIIGIILGITFRFTKKLDKTWLKAVLNFLAILISVAVGILFIKSLTESLLYAQPLIVRMGKNIYAFVADVVILELSLPVCMTMDRLLKKIAA